MTLTQRTLQRVHALFATNEEGEVAETLEACAKRLAFGEDAPRERVLFAVLKLSDGDIAKLRDAADLAIQDWRDVLVAAGFASDLQAHEKWLP